MSRIDEIKKRCEKAGKGPWIYTEDKDCISYVEYKQKPSDKFWKYVVHDWNTGRDNCEFIAHSREDIPYLLEVNSELLQACELIWELIETNQLQRNIDNDHKSDWVVQSMKVVMAIKNLNTAIKKTKELE